MFGVDLMAIVVGILGSVAGVFAVLWKLEKGTSQGLRSENQNLDREAKTASAQAKIAEGRANLHREAAKTTMKHHGIAEDKIQIIEKRIEDVANGESITVTT